MHRSRVCNLIIDCNDLETNLAFWSAALGVDHWALDGPEDNYGVLKEDVAGLHVELQRVPESSIAKSRIHFDIETDDVAAEVARLEALGAHRVEEHQGGRTNWWVMQDPCGNEFCVTSVQSDAWPKDVRSWDAGSALPGQDQTSFLETNVHRRFPRRLRRGDTVRVVAPARSRALVLEHDHSAIIHKRFAEMGLTLTYGAHVDERDDFDTSSIASRVEDLHHAFADAGVAAIMTAIGGFSSNELLPLLDWELIANHPKILCGFSDITALQNAILTKTGLVTYSGPHWSSFGMREHFEQTQQWFIDALFNSAPVEVRAATTWTDDLWFIDQDRRAPSPGEGWWPLQHGSAEGTVVGGNLCTLNLLQGTEFMPSLRGALLVLEDDSTTNPVTFARDLTSLLQLPDADGLLGVAIGRFQRDSQMTRNLLQQIIASQPRLAGLPVLANAEFGHTYPMATIPIGGTMALTAAAQSSITITEH